MDLSPLNLHLLLAASGNDNLLVKLNDASELENCTACIRDFAGSNSISRTFTVVPIELYNHANEIDDILERLIPSVGDNDAKKGSSGQIAQIVVLPYLERYPRHLHNAIKAVLRDGRFTLHGSSYNLPGHFMLIAVVERWEPIADYLVDAFGLSIELDECTPQPDFQIPPIIPLKPAAHYTPALRIYTADVLSAIRHHALIQNALLTARCSYQHLMKVATLWVRIKGYMDAVKAPKETKSYAQEVDLRPMDIADVLESCVLHRLRPRSLEQRWQTFWNKQELSEEAMKAEEALHNGARPRYDLILDEVLRKV